MKNKLDTEKEREALMRISLQVWKEADNSKLAKEAISIAQKCILKVECQKEHIKRLEEKREREKCKNCDWWTKQEASLQGRCARYGFYPTGEWFCAGWKEREEDE